MRRSSRERDPMHDCYTESIFPFCIYYRFIIRPINFESMTFVSNWISYICVSLSFYFGFNRSCRGTPHHTYVDLYCKIKWNKKKKKKSESRHAVLYNFIIHIHLKHWPSNSHIDLVVRIYTHRWMWNFVSLNRNYYHLREFRKSHSCDFFLLALIDSIDQTLVTTILCSQYKLNHKESFIKQNRIERSSSFSRFNKHRSMSLQSNCYSSATKYEIAAKLSLISISSITDDGQISIEHY